MKGKAARVAELVRQRKPISLELAQRDFFGLIDETMPFSEQSLAECLAEIAERADPDDVFFLNALVRALVHPESEWNLKLTRRKRGKFVPPDVAAEKHGREQAILYLLADLERGGMKTEAAVATIAERIGISRATVFACVRNAEAFLATGTQMLPESPNFQNPRPIIPRKA